MHKKKLTKKIVITICAAALAAGVAAFLIVYFFVIPKGSRGTNGGQSQPKYNVSSELSSRLTNADEVIDTVKDAIKNRSSAIGINMTLSGEYMDDVSPFVNEIISLAFTPTDDPKEGDYLRYQMGGYTISYGHEAAKNGYLYSVIITPTYYTTLAQEEEIDAKAEEVIAGLGIDENSSNYEKVKAVYDYVYSTVKYDLIHKKNENYTLKSTAYGALIYHSAICQGYCVTMYRLLKTLGVDCRVITGNASVNGNSEFHSWNIVEIDGLYYNLDITWDWQLGSHDFFLKSDADFPDHTRDEEFASEEFYQAYPMAAESY